MPSEVWLALTYSVGYLAIAAWNLAKQEPDLTEYLAHGLPEFGGSKGARSPSIEWWVRAVDRRITHLAELLAMLHPVVTHSSGKADR